MLEMLDKAFWIIAFGWWIAFQILIVFGTFGIFMKSMMTILELFESKPTKDDNY